MLARKQCSKIFSLNIESIDRVNENGIYMAIDAKKKEIRYDNILEKENKQSR